MYDAQKERARKLVKMLESAGDNHGLLVVQGNVVIRNGVQCTDSPVMFDEADLKNAIALGLLQKNVVSGSVNWEWHVLKTT
jgi:hypothetical protein